jgi:outer membrane receptor protein involved in Fe transport
LWGLFTLTVCILCQPALAGVTGKISGVVEEVADGEPLIGATVRVEGTDIITTTDEDGEYFIIGVPVGKFDVSVSHVGFESMLKKGVRVLLDLTTPVDFELRQIAVTIPEEVVVYATEPLIKRDLTASRVIYTADRLNRLPNTTTVQAVLNNYPGVVMDAQNELHIRGGRTGQVAYYYDGFSVQDPFVQNSGIRIIPAALEELTLTSGGFTAEYGDALSGVVSAVTREGGPDYHGSIRTYEELTHPYLVAEADWGKLDNLGDRSFAFDLSGPVPFADPKRFTFFSAGEYLRRTGSLPHDWQTTYTGVAKLSVQPTANLKLISNVTYYQSDGGSYDHRDVNDVSFAFNLDGLEIFEKEAYLIGMSGNYSLAKNVVLSATFNHFMTQTLSSPSHLMGTHWSDWPGYPDSVYINNYGNNPDYTDPYEYVGFAMGQRFDPTYANREAEYSSFRTSLISQINNANELKAGFEYRKYSVFWDFKQFYNVNPYGEVYHSRPAYGSVFAQDKIEYEDFVINAGLRFDFHTSDISYNVTPGDTIATYAEAEMQTRWSPRLGVSFPISTRSMMHFNYGVYYQTPRFTYRYTNLQGDISSGFPLLGNPDLEPEETTSYELGLDQLIGDGLRLDVTAYYKDIENLVSTREFIVDNKENVTVTRFENADYGSVTGFDLSLERLPGDGLVSGSIAYGYMVARGIGSTALEPYYTYITAPSDTLAPQEEFPLDFDQRHTLTAVVDVRAPRDWKGQLFGMAVPGAWSVNMVGYYGSGLPYTKTDVGGNRIGGRNDGRLPASYRVDMRINKDFYFGRGESHLSLFVEIDNVFNRHNVLHVYSSTGRPDSDGAVPQASLALQDQQDRLNYLDRMFDHDPQNFSLPRTIRIGTSYNF